MIFRIGHQISYTYSAPVFLEPHILCMRPRSEAAQFLRDFALAIEPQPAGIHDYLDAEDNCSSCLWFTEKTASLLISTVFAVETVNINPFGYLVTDNDFQRLPVGYADTEASALAPSLTIIDDSIEVREFGSSIQAETGDNTLDFLTRLCLTIYNNFTVEIRDRGLPLNPSATLKNRRGACRDLALLYMAVCRNAGLAARFVSGYQEGDQDMKRRQLHAWVEVYIPGGGWRGYDPTLGLVVADGHIALAASHDPGGVLPVRGSFRATGVSAEMDFHISLKVDSE